MKTFIFDSTEQLEDLYKTRDFAIFLAMYISGHRPIGISVDRVEVTWLFPQESGAKATSIVNDLDTVHAPVSICLMAIDVWKAAIGFSRMLDTTTIENYSTGDLNLIQLVSFCGVKQKDILVNRKICFLYGIDQEEELARAIVLGNEQVSMKSVLSSNDTWRRAVTLLNAR